MFCYSVSFRARAWYTGKQSNANGRGHYSKGISVCRHFMQLFMIFAYIEISAPSQVNVNFFFFFSEYYMERHENERAGEKQIIFK